MLILGVKDVLANRIAHVVPTTDINVFKRDIKNQVTKPSNSILHTNPEDFRVYKLAEFDEETGQVTACAEPQPLFYLSDLVNDSQVQ